MSLIQDYCLAVLRSRYNEKHMRLTASHNPNSQKQERAAAFTHGQRPVRAEPKVKSSSPEFKAGAFFHISCCPSTMIFIYLFICTLSLLTKNESIELTTLPILSARL